jgi:hypothetical protein
VSGQLHTPAALPRGKSPRYPLDTRLGGLQSLSGRRGEGENSWPYRNLNSDPSAIQPVVSRYTDYAIPAPLMNWIPHLYQIRYVISVAKCHVIRNYRHRTEGLHGRHCIWRNSNLCANFSYPNTQYEYTMMRRRKENEDCNFLPNVRCFFQNLEQYCYIMSEKTSAAR